jgi:hypothetical protein
LIVPTGRAVTNHTASSAYKAFQTALQAAGVANRSVHSTRLHRRGALERRRPEAGRAHHAQRRRHHPRRLQRFESESLCSAVTSIDYAVDRHAKPAFFAGVWLRQSPLTLRAP